ncbi:substrate-binding domain-containing protein [Nakamurella aerolata]|uniref:LacI family DNA-binding transcriptional regulator n=1 Tax=Nakamurella aerolata TaxID=1656892 RepID=A0A849A9E0_9ACTN|nr:LacI family DNA-binding transcriptional regulator [Nakamurella aerolata]
MATIADVARLAGVSTATVSRVINNNADVDPVLAARVRKAIADLNYRPSRLARSLRTRRSTVWAVIISDIRNPFFTDMVRGIEDLAYANNYSLMLCNAEEDLAKEHDYLSLAVDEHMAGVILAPASPTETDLDPLHSNAIPVVTVDRRLQDPTIDRVLIDNHGGAAAAVEHLWANGFRRIGCISGPPAVTTGADRLAGYRDGLIAHHVHPDDELVRFGDFHTESAKRAMAELLQLPTPPDAVFVANNLMTIGALEAIAEAGLAVPDDIGIVGFDDMSWAALLQPPLTTIGQPTYEVGAETARLLLSRLSGYAGKGREVVLPTQLYQRASSVRTTTPPTPTPPPSQQQQPATVPARAGVRN